MERADRITLALAVAIGGVLLGWLLSAAYALSPLGKPEAARPLLDWQDAASVAHGRTVYAAHCATCHGASGEGQRAQAGVPASQPLAPPQDATGHTWQHPDFALFQFVKSGTSAVMCLTLDPAMPRFAETLSDREIADVLAYLKSRWPAAIRARQEDVNAVYADHNALLRRQVKFGG